MMVTIEKFNDAYLRIKCESSVGRELAEFFQFEVPNAKFMPSVRSRMWDGKVRLFSPGTGKIYYGLLPYVVKFLKEQNYEITLAGDFEVEPYDRKLIEQYVRSLEKGKFRARDYQIDAIYSVIKNNRGLILSPTGSGKSFIIYVLVRYYLEKLEDESKILVVVPNTSLVEQLFGDFQDYGWFPEEYSHRIYGGADKQTSKPIVISTWQSIYKMPTSYFDQFGCVFVDEAHLAKAKSLTGIMTKLHDCKYRIGLTGTLDGTELHRLVLEGLFNVHHQVTTTSELIEKKQLSQLHIRVLVLEHTEQNKRLMKDKDYMQEMEYISTHLQRNKFIRNLVSTLEGNTLVLAQYVKKQLIPLCEMIVKQSGDDRNIYLIHGATPTDDREKVRELVEKNDNCIIVASYGTFSTGVNIKRIHNIVFASPYKSQIRVLQSLGRGLRLAEDKTELNLYDIADDIRHKKMNYTLKHLSDRIKLYAEQGFDYDIIPVKLKDK